MDVALKKQANLRLIYPCDKYANRRLYKAYSLFGVCGVKENIFCVARSFYFGRSGLFVILNYLRELAGNRGRTWKV